MTPAAKRTPTKAKHEELESKSAKRQAEAAPKMHTPEAPEELPEDTPRDEESRQETPEGPVVEERELTRFESLTTAEEAEVAELHRHVAQNPVDAHAPTWVLHTPNSP